MWNFLTRCYRAFWTSLGWQLFDQVDAVVDQDGEPDAALLTLHNCWIAVSESGYADVRVFVRTLRAVRGLTLTSLAGSHALRVTDETRQTFSLNPRGVTLYGRMSYDYTPKRIGRVPDEINNRIELLRSSVPMPVDSQEAVVLPPVLE